MDATTRQDDEKFVYVVGLTEGQKVYSVARRLHSEKDGQREQKEAM